MASLPSAGEPPLDCLLFLIGEPRQPLLEYARGQADLKRYGKDWFLFQTLEAPAAEPVETTDFIGVDAGVCTVASAADGRQTLRFPGNKMRHIRTHHDHLRRGLQRHNTRSSRRRVRKLRDKESRTVRAYNHGISRHLVDLAKRTNSTLVLEDLEGLRAGVKVPKSQRRERFSWAYAQLQAFILYKARLAGIPVFFVLPDYTSKTCSRCHYMSDRNRASQAWFQCRECGFCCHADDNAACNIRFLGAESTCQKRTVSMQEVLHTDRRKPLRFSQR
jgi:putative transposase